MGNVPGPRDAGGTGASDGQYETSRAAFEAIFDQSSTGLFLTNTRLILIRVNERFARLYGKSPEECCGLTPYHFLSRGEADRLAGALRHVLDTGDPVVDMQVMGSSPIAPGRRRWAISLYRLHGVAGEPVGVAGLATDVTVRQRAEQEAAHTRRDLDLLNEAGTRIGNSLDLETTARQLLDVAVPHFCDLAVVDLYQALLTGDEDSVGVTDGSGEVCRVAGASAVSGGPELLGGEEAVPVGAVHRYPFNSSAASALRTAQVQVVEDGEQDGVVHSTLLVPLVGRDTVLGLAQFSRTKGSEPFCKRDTALAAELAARAAVCIDNARLYRREHERALLLQHSLLPPGNPEAAGLDIACRYLPGNTAAEVGGDWFDVIALPGHRTALVVGDVMGRGLRAAVAMGELRMAVRTLALLDMEPVEILTHLDEIARGLSDLSGGRPRRTKERDGSDLAEVYLATCVYAVYDPVMRRCTLANAGHLPPVIVQPGDPALMLDVPAGMPLGVGGEPFEEVEIDLPDGALLALYTDGLVESRRHPLDVGLEAFREAISGATQPLEEVCDHVLTSLETHHGEDDVALLMARVHGLSAESVGDWTLPPEGQSVAKARELVLGRLEGWGLGELADTSELLVSELVTNALRYGEGDIRLRLLLDRTLVCEVWDSGLVQPRRRRARDTDEGGRGLQLVSLLSEGWGTRRTPHGKTVWFELVLPGNETPGPDLTEVLASAF
ncbi:MAG: SpoIIE family protein phosphatase [Streptomycetaceae bacterium]|nr:SpoIIE family protein phosphatase [Streptomycetaceae bacterium]